MYIVTERWESLKFRMSSAAWARIKDTARWEHMTLSAVVCEYPSLVPANLRKLAASCFVDGYADYLEARRVELRRALADIERRLATERAREGR